MTNKPLFTSVVTGIVAGIIAYGIFAPLVINADVKNSLPTKATLVNNGHLTICKLDKSDVEVVKVIKNVVFTAYSSTPDQTDSTPFLTASQKQVEDGFIATNDLPFGTKVRIPALYGEKIFTVEDRMHERFTGKKRVDIWFAGEEIGRKKAIEFGAKKADLEIVES